MVGDVSWEKLKAEFTKITLLQITQMQNRYSYPLMVIQETING